MKRTLGILFLFLLVAQFSFGQKWGFVDTDYILNQLPEYKAAQEEIEQESAKWQAELEKKYQKIEEMYAAYRQEEVLLPEDIKQKRQEEIFEAERKAKEYKKSKFGYDGELYKLQDEKIKPIQDDVLLAVDGVAKEKKVDFIFDKAANTGLIFASPRYDRTRDVLNKMGVYGTGKPGSGTKPKPTPKPTPKPGSGGSKGRPIGGGS